MDTTHKPLIHWLRVAQHLFSSLFLEGLSHLQHLDINNCQYISELEHLNQVAQTLQYLDIGNCPRISDVSPVANLT